MPSGIQHWYATHWLSPTVHCRIVEQRALLFSYTRVHVPQNAKRGNSKFTLCQSYYLCSFSVIFFYFATFIAVST